MRRKSGLHIAHVVGKWNTETCNDFYRLIKKRVIKPTNKCKLKIISDGNKQNIEAIKNNFDENCVNYAQVIKIRDNQIVVALEKRNVFGKTNEEEITMHKIDSYCGTLRERIPIYVRETKAFSKKRQNIENRLDIYQLYRNFVWAKKRITPAMIEGIAKKPLNWEAIITKRY